MAVLAVCGLLLLAVLLVFAQTARHEFVNFDDDQYVTENDQVARGLSVQGFEWALHNHAGNWHPLTWLSHMLDCQMYRLWPGGHHLTNVLLHAATAILLLLVLRSMTGDLWPAAMVAAVFAIHPLRVESVAWVAERKDLLSGLFFVLTLGAYVGYVRRPFSLIRYLAIVVSFAVGLACKPMLVTLPLVLLLLDVWPLGRLDANASAADNRRSPWRLVVEKIPLAALAAASCMATLAAQDVAIHKYPASWRIENALVSYVAYLGQMFWPVRLAALYPHPLDSVPGWKVFGAVLVLAAISAVAIAGRRKFPELLVGWLWYLGMLVPVIGLVQVGGQAMADRYTYLPEIGLCLAIAWMLTGCHWLCRCREPAPAEALAEPVPPGEALAESVAPRVIGWICAGCHWLCQCRESVPGKALAPGETLAEPEPPWPSCRLVYAPVAALVLALLMACAWQQTTTWRDNDTLWNHVLASTSPNYRAHNNLGIVLTKRGRFDEAIGHFREALKIRPEDVEAHTNLGIALFRTGRIDEAIEHYEKALAIDPSCVAVHNNLGNALGSKGRFDEAIAQYRKALETPAPKPEIYFNLGGALLQQGRLDEAIVELRKGLEIRPGDAEIRKHLGLMLQRRGRTAEALVEWREAARLRPDDPVALGLLAGALAETGQFREAIDAAERALAIASAQGNAALAGALRARIQLYRAGRARPQ